MDTYLAQPGYARAGIRGHYRDISRLIPRYLWGQYLFSKTYPPVAGCIYANTLQHTVILVGLGTLQINIPSREEQCLAYAMLTRQARDPNVVPPQTLSKGLPPPGAPSWADG